MNIKCRCALHPLFMCVACKVKRGAYLDWMLVEYPRAGASDEHKAIYWSVRKPA